MLYIGLDLGTSALKLLLADEEGNILNTIQQEYPLSFPHPGWSEQNPEDWKQAVLTGIPKLLEGVDPSQVAGIGAGGQMHGLVVLDESDRVIRPAILWNDGRTAPQTDYLNRVVGEEKLAGYTANIAFAGFTAPKLLWMRQEEPELFARIRKIMLPKDYINYVLSGVHCTDVSDASGTLLFDVRNRTWSREMLEICGISEEQLPRIFESYEAVGTILPEMAKALGLRETVVVAAGAGDNAAAAIGTGTVGEGACNISLGTSGTIFISSDHFQENEVHGIHSFAHADGGWHLMGCMLSAASCNKWWLEDILETTDYDGEQERIPRELLGENPVFFLPYLMGERSPINDTNARGTFVGMSLNTTRAQMSLAVLEGVAFAIRDSLEIAGALGISVEKSTICGGGAKSDLWKTIMANVLNVDILVTETEQGPGMGGAMLAMTAAGAYPHIRRVCGKFVHMKEEIHPDPVLAEKYEKRYQKYRKIYPALKPVYRELL